MQNYFLADPCINLLVNPSVTRKYHPKALERFYLLQSADACSAHWLGFLERHKSSAFLVLIFIPAKSHVFENRSRA